MKNPRTNQQSDKGAFRQWLDAMPILQFVGAGVIGLCATWTTIQLSQNSQAAEIRRASERVERLEKEFVSRELFDERTRAMREEQLRQSLMIEKILENQRK
jgi:hypothetical protein